MAFIKSVNTNNKDKNEHFRCNTKETIHKIVQK